MCDPCDADCNICQGPTSIECSVCSFGFFFEAPSSCVVDCSAGFWENPAVPPICSPCEATW